MQKEAKKIVVWNVTDRCNMNCKFCYGPEKVEDFSTAKGLKIIDGFKNDGAEKIVFTGGEPLLRDDLAELIKYAKKKRLYTILHTNGLLLTKEKLRLFGKYLDQINLPLDGYDEKTNSMLRRKDSFKKVMDILKDLKGNDLRIVISTVVTKLNKNCIVKIGQVLPDWVCKWRIFQFRSEGKAIDAQKKCEILDEDFRKICCEIKQQNWSFEVQYVSNNDKEFYESYCLI